MDDDFLWYKDAIIYEIPVKSFFDSNGDGIGDFQGLTRKLDYLQELGITTVWLLPFFPSPLKDDGYDIADYFTVNPLYGSLNDFKSFLKEAHRRQIRVLIELVLNHTSDKHPWFERARRAPKGSVERDFYVWSDTNDKFLDARIIFQDYESSNWQWDPIAESYYWHRFFSHQPDLNFDNPEVCKEIFRVLAFWLDMGVDGFRLDAVPYLYEREGTNCENLPQTHALLRQLRKKVDRRYGSRVFLAEANQWPEEAAHYFGKTGDECHMAFHFPIMPRLFMALHMEERFPILDIAMQTPPIPEKAQWALFLRNHDELTLEMITDEEREEMHKAYAPDPRARINLGIRRRLSPLLHNDRRKIELMNILLLSLIGTPVLYYGDEIGMGDNIFLEDRNSVRTPMQWNDNRNAGFSDANPQKLYLPVVTDPAFHYQTINVKAQEATPSSLLHWTRRVIAIRKRHKAFGRGTIDFLHPQNQKILAYFRQYENERVLVVVNLSRYSQPALLDLKTFQGQYLVDLFSGQTFPQIEEAPYLLTLSPYGYYWFRLQQEPSGTQPRKELPLVEDKWDWSKPLKREAKWKVEAILPEFLHHCPWHKNRGKRIEKVKILSDFVIERNRSAPCHLLVIKVHYAEDQEAHYMLPLATIWGEDAANLMLERPEIVLGRWKERSIANSEGILYEATQDVSFLQSLSLLLQGEASPKASHGEIIAAPAKFPSQVPIFPERLHFRYDEHGTLHVPFDQWIFRIFHRLEERENPDVEMERFLNEESDFTHLFSFSGCLEYASPPKFPRVAIALLLHTRPHAHPLSEYSRSLLQSFTPAEPHLPFSEQLLLSPSILSDEPPLALPEPFEPYRLLGKRLAEFHNEMAALSHHEEFAPTPFTLFYQRSLYQTLRKLIAQTLTLLQERMDLVPRDLTALAGALFKEEKNLLHFLRPLITGKIDAKRLRIHGNLTLQRVFYNGRDLFLTDFQGEADRPIGERRSKNCPLRDAAKLLCSMHQLSGTEKDPSKEAEAWFEWAGSAFLSAYLQALRGCSFLPSNPEQANFLFRLAYLESLFCALRSELEAERMEALAPLLGALAQFVKVI